jgi:hypothetical protein
MSEPLVIPVPAGDLFKPNETSPVRGDGARMVPMVPVGGGNFLPCIIRSREVVTVDSEGLPLKDPSNECLLLVSRNPYAVLRAYVDVAAWQSCREQPIEW